MVVRTSNVRDGNLIEEGIKCTTKQGFHEWTKRGLPEAGDVFFTREAPAGETCLVPEDKKVCLGQRMVLLKPNKMKIDSEFLIHFFTSSVGTTSIYKLSIGTTVTRINIEDIYKIHCIVPPLIEQRKIADILFSVDERLKTKKQKLTQTKTLKKALMHDLLTGKKRVKVVVD